MSVLNCIAGLVKSGKLSEEQADLARQVYRGVLQDDLFRNMNDATREAHAALKTAEILDAAAKAKKLELANSVKSYNDGLARIAAHPDGQIPGLMGMLTPDIRNAPLPEGFSRVNAESLRDAHYFPQIAAKMHEVSEAYGSKLGGLKQDVIGVRKMIYENHGVNTGDKVAAEASKAWKAATDFATKTAQDLGKVFDTDKDWNQPQWWESSRVEKAGAVEFKADIQKRYAETGRGGIVIVDPDTKTAVTGADRERVLNEATKHIREDRKTGTGASSVLNPNTRVFRFTQDKAGADAYLDLMDKYGMGQGGYFNAMQGHAARMAQELAMLHMFGPRYGAVTDKLLEAAIAGDKTAQLAEADRIKAGAAPKTKNIGEKIEDKIAKWGGLEGEIAAKHLNDYMNGRLSAVGSETVAGFFSGLRAFISMAKLGSAPITAIPGDAANWSMASKFRGLSTGRLAADITGDLLTGPGDKVAIATRLGVTAHAVSRVAIATKQYGDQMFGNNLSGLLQRMSDFHLRATRLHAYDSAITRAFPMEFMATIGDNEGKSFADLDPAFKRFWTDYGFNEAEWNKIANGGDANAFLRTGSTKFFMPDSLDGPLRAKLMSAVGDEKKFAYLAGGSDRVRSLTASNDGRFLAKAAQAFWMFKTFPLTMMATHGMRAAQEGSAGISGIGYALNLALFTTVAGAVALQARQIVQGRDPLNMNALHGGATFWASAALQGGALGVYGDLLRDVTGTNDQSLAEILQGPQSGLLGDLGRITSEVSKRAHGEKSNVGAALAHFVSHWTPGSNTWYAMLLLNRMVFDNIQKQIDPSYARSFARAQAQALKVNGQKFWWAPGQTVPDRGPNLGAAVQ